MATLARDLTARARDMGVTFKPITGVFGANVTGLDLSQPLNAATVDLIEDAICVYRVLAFRGQEGVTAPQLQAFASNFGAPETAEHPTHPNHPDAPGVKVLVSNSPAARRGIVDTWHSDGPTRDETRYISVLQAIDIPEVGRDTAFADMVTAYERLSTPMKQFLEGLTGENNWGMQKPGTPSKFHPLVLTDRRSGARALYANKLYTVGIPELRNDEAAAMLEFLFAQARVLEFQLRVNWDLGTIAMWNNELVQHYLVFDCDYQRVMHRVMVC